MRESIYYFENFHNSEDLTKLIMVGHSWCDKTYEIKRQDAAFYTFEFIISGKTILNLNNEKHLVYENTGYIMPKNSNQHYYAYDEDFEKIWVCFDGAIFEAFVQNFIGINNYILNSPYMYSLMNEIIELAVLDVEYNVKHIEIIKKIMEIFLLFKPKNPRENTTADEIKLLIDKNICSVFSLDYISGEMGYCKNQIINIFKKAFSITPHMYYQNTRLEISKE